MTTIADSWSISIADGWILLMLIGMGLWFVLMLGSMWLMRDGRGWAICGRRWRREAPLGNIRTNTRLRTVDHAVSTQSKGER